MQHLERAGHALARHARPPHMQHRPLRHRRQLLVRGLHRQVGARLQRRGRQAGVQPQVRAVGLVNQKGHAVGVAHRRQAWVCGVGGGVCVV